MKHTMKLGIPDAHLTSSQNFGTYIHEMERYPYSFSSFVLKILTEFSYRGLLHVCNLD
jgi:hypothetical protein